MPVPQVILDPTAIKRPHPDRSNHQLNLPLAAQGPSTDDTTYPTHLLTFELPPKRPAWWQLRQCMRLNQDCADLCLAAGTVSIRRNEQIIAATMQARATACRVRAD
jgi:hypothetical protein